MWQTSETIGEVSKALVDAQSNMKDIAKGREAKVQMKSGGNYGYKYADLADVLQSIRPHLATAGLAVLQNASSISPETVMISTTILHSSGEWITFDPLSLSAGRTAQETGSAISYGRRYHLLACLGLAADDDDGAMATAGVTQRIAQQKKAPQKANAEPRTTEEKAIYEILGSLDVKTRQTLKQQFVDKYGLLPDLPVEQHPDALAWVEDWIGN